MVPCVLFVVVFCSITKKIVAAKGEIYTMGMRQKSGEGQPAGQFVSVY